MRDLGFFYGLRNRFHDWCDDHRLVGAKALLRLLRKLYRHRDETLADIIHQNAAIYQTRPAEGWAPNVDMDGLIKTYFSTSDDCDA